MWQTKYAAAIPKNLGVGVNFRLCSEGYFLSGRPQSVDLTLACYLDHYSILKDYEEKSCTKKIVKIQRDSLYYKPVQEIAMIFAILTTAGKIESKCCAQKLLFSPLDKNFGATLNFNFMSPKMILVNEWYSGHLVCFCHLLSLKIMLAFGPCFSSNKILTPSIQLS